MLQIWQQNFFHCIHKGPHGTKFRIGSKQLEYISLRAVFMLSLSGLCFCSIHAFQPIIRVKFLVCSVYIISVITITQLPERNKYIKFSISVFFLCLTAEYYVSSCGDQVPDPGGAYCKFPSCMQTAAFWDMTRYSLLETYRRFRGTCCIYIYISVYNIASRPGFRRTYLGRPQEMVE